MKKLLFLLLLPVIVLAEQTGPYYISFPAFCDVYEVYYDNDVITGNTIGCGDRERVPITGRLFAEQTNLMRNGKVSRYSKTSHYKEITFVGEGRKYTDILEVETGVSKLYVGDEKAYLVGTTYIEADTFQEE